MREETDRLVATYEASIRDLELERDGYAKKVEGAYRVLVMPPDSVCTRPILCG